jgi:hypothetical protein
MPINIEIKVVPFGQVRLEIGKPVLLIEERQTIPEPQVIRYHEPQETVSGIYEIQYVEKLTNYITPLTTR